MIRLFGVFIPISSLALLISEALLLVSSFIVAAYVILAYDPYVFLLVDGGIWRVLIAAITVLIGMHLNDLYTNVYVKSRLLLLQQLSLTMGLAFLTMGVLSYADPGLRMPIRLMLLGSAFAVVGVFVWRLLFANYLLQMVGAQRILFVGCNSSVEAIARHMTEHTEMGMSVLGYLDDTAPPGTPRTGGEVLGGIGALQDVASRLSPDHIVVSLSARLNFMPVTGLLDLGFSGVQIEEAGSSYESVFMRVSALELRPAQIVSFGHVVPQRGIVQSALNLALALIGAGILLPVMLLVAVGVKLTSSGPALHGETRLGLDGALFTLYKFRSTADGVTTRFGAFLRRFRLDELPQLFNVLRGDMAIVGPRPERPAFVAALAEKIPFYRQRYCVKPGITGWAQVNQKFHDPFPDAIAQLEYDLYYVKNLSLSLDAYIIFHTLKTLLFSRGF